MCLNKNCSMEQSHDDASIIILPMRPGFIEKRQGTNYPTESGRGRGDRKKKQLSLALIQGPFILKQILDGHKGH